MKAVDGHDLEADRRGARRWAQAEPRPTLIACRTMIGNGAPTMEGTDDTHGAALGAAEIAAARAALGWPHAPFVIPDDVCAAWRAAGRARRQGPRRPGSARLAASPHQRRASSAPCAATCPPALRRALDAHIAELAADAPEQRHPQASGAALEALIAGAAGHGRRLGRPDRLQQHLRQGHAAFDRPDYARPLRPLRRARARHGRGHERHGPARRGHPLRRHLPGLLRLLPARRSAWRR